MGCDGGTIPKRKEIVKNKQKDQVQDKNVDRSATWQFCALSGLPLKKPIVACRLGRMYNKTAIIEYLLEQKISQAPQQTVVSHLKSLKDVRELKLKEKVDYNNAHQATSGSEQFQAQFVCPISGLVMNGAYKFFYLTTCGCVLAERAFKQVPNESLCILCSKPYDASSDLIVLNGDRDEVELLKERLKDRRRQQKSSQKESLETKKHSSLPSTSTSSSSSKHKSSRERKTESLPIQKRLKS